MPICLLIVFSLLYVFYLVIIILLVSISLPSAISAYIYIPAYISLPLSTISTYPVWVISVFLICMPCMSKIISWAFFTAVGRYAFIIVSLLNGLGLFWYNSAVFP